MTKARFRLTVKSEFASAHSLRHYKGKCEAVHGHNFSVEATIEGEKLTPDTELLLDFTDFKLELSKVIDMLDHKDLNKLPPFDRINPTSENLARHIYRELAMKVESYGVRMSSVTVSESGKQSATYMEV